MAMLTSKFSDRKSSINCLGRNLGNQNLGRCGTMRHKAEQTISASAGAKKSGRSIIFGGGEQIR